MKRLFVALAAVLSVPTVAAAITVSPIRPVTTYSIVARDPDTGELGVAVQSHWFSVGQLVPWARAGSAPWPPSPWSSPPTVRTAWT